MVQDELVGNAYRFLNSTNASMRVGFSYRGAYFFSLVVAESGADLCGEPRLFFGRAVHGRETSPRESDDVVNSIFVDEAFEIFDAVRSVSQVGREFLLEPGVESDLGNRDALHGSDAKEASTCRI